MTDNPTQGTRSMPASSARSQSSDALQTMTYRPTNRAIECYAQSNGNGTYGGRVAITVQAGPYSGSVVREWPDGENFRSPQEATEAAMQCARRAFPPPRLAF